MGKEIRNSKYCKDVLHGKRSLKKQEAAVITNKYGIKRTVFGPCVVKLVCSNIKFLDRYIANSDQFLRIIHKINKTIEHIQGPCEKFLLPIHEEIKVLEVIKLKDIDVLYRITDEDEAFVKGPMNYLPSPLDKLIKVFRNGILLSCIQLADVLEKSVDISDKAKFRSSASAPPHESRNVIEWPTPRSTEHRPLSTDALKTMHLQYMRPVTVADVMSKRQRNSRSNFSFQSEVENWSSAYKDVSNVSSIQNDKKISSQRTLTEFSVIDSRSPARPGVRLSASLRSPLSPLLSDNGQFENKYYENPLRGSPISSEITLNALKPYSLPKRSAAYGGTLVTLSSSPSRKCNVQSTNFQYNKDLKTLTFAL